MKIHLAIILLLLIQLSFAADKPNVLVILTDDLGYSDIGCYGSEIGQRDGDLKLVSFKSQPWELYDISKDRTELNNLAAQHTERVAAMAKAWQGIAKETMARDFKPVASEDKPKAHPEWTDYTGRKKPVRKK